MLYTSTTPPYTSVPSKYMVKEKNCHRQAFLKRIASLKNLMTEDVIDEDAVGCLHRQTLSPS